MKSKYYKGETMEKNVEIKEETIEVMPEEMPEEEEKKTQAKIAPEEKPKVEERDVVIPGEVLAEGMGFLPSDGTYREGDEIKANALGLVSIKGRVIKVIPLSGRYIPQSGDLVIGVITEARYSSWMVDLDSPFMGMLSVGDAVDRFVDLEKDDLSKYFTIGDTVLAQVTNATDIIKLTLRGPGLRKLREGMIIDVEPVKVPRIIGKGGSMIQVIREGTGVSIVVGRNGRVWIKGEKDKVRAAVNAIKTIERESHIKGLTDKIREMLQIS